MQHQLSEQLRARLARALGEQPVAVAPQRAAEAVTPREYAVDESFIRTVLRAPIADLGEGAAAVDDGGVVEAVPAVADSAPGVVGRALDRLPFTRRHLVIVVIIATLAVAMAGWFLLQARAVPLDDADGPEVSVSTSASAPSAAVSSADAPAPAMIKVHVTGAVRRPQVVSVPEGARVGEVVDAAGGLAKGAVLGQLNLAQPVQDGQQVYVSASKGEPSEVRDPGAAPGGAATSGPGGTSPSGTGQQVDLNSATVAELEALPGVGPVTAQSIVAWREQHGRFSRVEELQEVDGIGPKTFARLAPHVRV